MSGECAGTEPQQKPGGSDEREQSPADGTSHGARYSARVLGRGTAPSWPAAARVLAVVAALAAAVTIGFWLGSRRDRDAVAGPAAGNQRAPDARKILERALAAYEEADTYQAQGKVITVTTLAGMHQTLEVPFTVAYQRPNLLRAEAGEGGSLHRTVCDGRSLHVEDGREGRVARIPAPEDLGELQTESGYVGGCGYGAPPEIAGFTQIVEHELGPDSVTSVEGGFDDSNEWLASLDQPEGTVVVRLLRKDKVPVVVWIDESSHVVRQAAAESRLTDRVAELPDATDEDEKAEVLETLTSMFGDVERTVVVYDLAVLGEAVPEGTFAYEAPDGFEVAEAADVWDLARALGNWETLGVTKEMAGPESVAGQHPLDFAAQDMDGNTVRLSEFRGQPLVVSFWPGWYSFRQVEIERLEQIHRELGGRGLQVVAVFTDPTLEWKVKSLLEFRPVSFPTLWLPEQAKDGEKVGQAYDVFVVPRTLYINSDWVIKADTTGLREKGEMLSHIRKLGIDTAGAD